MYMYMRILCVLVCVCVCVQMHICVCVSVVLGIKPHTHMCQESTLPLRNIPSLMYSFFKKNTVALGTSFYKFSTSY